MSLLDEYDFHCNCECFNCMLDIPEHCCIEVNGCGYPTSFEVIENKKNPLPFEDED